MGVHYLLSTGNGPYTCLNWHLKPSQCKADFTIGVYLPQSIVWMLTLQNMWNYRSFLQFSVCLYSLCEAEANSDKSFRSRFYSIQQYCKPRYRRQYFAEATFVVFAIYIIVLLVFAWMAGLCVFWREKHGDSVFGTFPRVYRKPIGFW